MSLEDIIINATVDGFMAYLEGKAEHKGILLMLKNLKKNGVTNRQIYYTLNALSDECEEEFGVDFKEHLN